MRRFIAQVIAGALTFSPVFANEPTRDYYVTEKQVVEPNLVISIDDNIYDNPAEPLVARILELNPQIIAFGEFHYNGNEVKSTLSRFAEGILPAVYELGYGSLLTEYLVCGTPEREIASYYENGIIDDAVPFLKLAHIFAGNQLLDLLNKCRELGIGLHGCGSSAEEIKKYLEFLEENPENPSAAVQLFLEDYMSPISQNCLDYLSTLKPEQKAMVYTGGYHNDFQVNDYLARLSFGDELYQNTSYLEVDLVVPEIVQGTPREGNIFAGYNLLASEDGFNVFYTDEKRQHMVLLYPLRLANEHFQ